MLIADHRGRAVKNTLHTGRIPTHITIHIGHPPYQNHLEYQLQFSSALNRTDPQSVGIFNKTLKIISSAEKECRCHRHEEHLSTPHWSREEGHKSILDWPGLHGSTLWFYKGTYLWSKILTPPITKVTKSDTDSQLFMHSDWEALDAEVKRTVFILQDRSNSVPIWIIMLSRNILSLIYNQTLDSIAPLISPSILCTAREVSHLQK